MSRRDLAETLLRKADQDQMVFEKLRLDQDVAIDILGFHAQQAAEKLLKSTLAGQEINFPFSHRLTDLFDLLKENGVFLPEEFEELRFLTPFAVAFRYELYAEEEEEPFDSDRVTALLAKLREWTIASLPAPNEETMNVADSRAAIDEPADVAKALEKESPDENE